METKIISQKKNLFLEREEFVLEIKNKTAPTFDEVKSEIGKDADLIVIKKVNTNFGKQIFLTEAVVYDNVKAKEKIETIPQKVRKKIEADRKSEEEAKKKTEEEAKKVKEKAKATPEETENTEAPGENKTKEEEKAPLGVPQEKGGKE